MKKVYENAMYVADYLLWDKIECNDGMKIKKIDEIHEEIYSLIKRKK